MNGPFWYSIVNRKRCPMVNQLCEESQWMYSLSRSRQHTFWASDLTTSFSKAAQASTGICTLESCTLLRFNKGQVDMHSSAYNIVSERLLIK